MPEDGPTLGEIARRLEHVHQDLKEDIHAMSVRMDKKVDKDVLALEQAAQDAAHKSAVERITKIEADRKADARKRESDRRWVIAAIAVPILVVVLGVALQLLFSTPEFPS